MAKCLIMIAAISIACIRLFGDAIEEGFGDFVFDQGTCTNGEKMNIIWIVEVCLLCVLNRVTMTLEVTTHIKLFHKRQQSVHQWTVVLSVNIHDLVVPFLVRNELF